LNGVGYATYLPASGIPLPLTAKVSSTEYRKASLTPRCKKCLSLGLTACLSTLESDTLRDCSQSCQTKTTAAYDASVYRKEIERGKKEQARGSLLESSIIRPKGAVSGYRLWLLRLNKLFYVLFQGCLIGRWAQQADARPGGTWIACKPEAQSARSNHESIFSSLRLSPAFEGAFHQITLRMVLNAGTQ
jgi:hypothetical protein